MEENTREYELAYELAETLDDVDSLMLYESFVRQYAESVLREKLAKVMATPKEKIRLNRAAFFNYLMQQHARKRRFNSRN